MSIKSIFMGGTRYIKDLYYQDAHIWKSTQGTGQQINTYALHYDANHKVSIFDVGAIAIGPDADPTRTKIYAELTFYGERYYMVIDPTMYEGQEQYANIQGTLAYVVKASDVAEIKNGGVIRPLLTHMRHTLTSFFRKQVMA